MVEITSEAFRGLGVYNGSPVEGADGDEEKVLFVSHPRNGLAKNGLWITSIPVRYFVQDDNTGRIPSQGFHRVGKRY